MKAVLAVALLVFCAATPQSSPQNSNVPVSKPGILVELFTSEGCSSCPPADELLRQLDAQSDKTNREIVVLSEHVDYWDHDGWRDRFSSHDYTDRQEEYARRFHIEAAYTPEMVVDGQKEFTGNDAARLQAALHEASSHPKATLMLSTESVNPAEILVRVQTGALPTRINHADLYVALADNNDETRVQAGENSGRNLRHVAVLRTLQKVSKVGPDSENKDVRLRLPKSGNSGTMRVVAFLQEPDNGPVLGATMKMLREPTR